jgi:hypothetical protein
MYVLLSPAKKLDEGASIAELPSSEFSFFDDVAVLLKTARRQKLADLRKLMGISEPLGQLNVERFAAMSLPMNADNARQAALLFAGDTYQGLAAASLSKDDLIWAQDHLGILSGFYGLLRPLDAIQPYRLEMGTALKTRRGKNLYEFWGERIAKLIDHRLLGHAEPLVINCASGEYFKAVAKKSLQAQVITPVFLEQKGDVAKTISFLAKKARGAMARYVVVNRLSEPQALQGFNELGYVFDDALSSFEKPVFVARRG